MQRTWGPQSYRDSGRGESRIYDAIAPRNVNNTSLLYLTLIPQPRWALLNQVLVCDMGRLDSAIAERKIYGTMEDTKIKMDPEAAGSPAGLSEEDIYEEAGDLEFNTNPAFQSLYLARTRLSMLLTSNLAEHQTIPKEYDLDITAQSVSNTFVFTEKDLPGFKSRSRANHMTQISDFSHIIERRSRVSTVGRVIDLANAFTEKTTLAGKIAHEINCIAVDNQESQRLLAERTLEAMKPKLHTKFLKEDVSTLGPGFIQPGSINAQNSFNTFIKTTSQTTKDRPQMMKTARMPQNELLDRIFDCFRKYNYWSMKALRSELQQPEVYLRETLEKIAVLAKSGRFATQWSLRPENKIDNYEAMGDVFAPTSEGMGNDDSDLADEEDGDEDGDVKFEDRVWDFMMILELEFFLRSEVRGPWPLDKHSDIFIMILG
ncbi:hypothetical protein PZA11_003009 [Diplocarpon coronariae]